MATARGVPENEYVPMVVGRETNDGEKSLKEMWEQADAFQIRMVNVVKPHPCPPAKKRDRLTVGEDALMSMLSHDVIVKIFIRRNEMHPFQRCYILQLIFLTFTSKKAINMSFQAYIDNIRAKTGKTPDDFRKIAEGKGLLKEGVKAGAIVAWLKEDYDLGHGHAMAIYATFKGMKNYQ